MIDTIIESILINKDLKKHEKLSAILKYIFVDICHIDQNKYYLLGSYAIREHRKINDLDINLDFEEFCKVLVAIGKGFGVVEYYNEQVRWFYDMTEKYNELNQIDEKDFSIEAFQKHPNEGFPNTNFSLAYLRQNEGLNKDSNGHQFFSLKTLLEWKKTMNRPKDQDDIKIIENILSGKQGGARSKRRSKTNTKAKSKSKSRLSRSKPKTKGKSKSKSKSKSQLTRSKPKSKSKTKSKSKSKPKSTKSKKAKSRTK